MIDEELPTTHFPKGHFVLDTCAAKLRLLETTDLHMQLTGYDYVLDNHVACGGLERLSGSIAALRNDGIATILCDNGDFLEGSPLADLAMDLDDMREHPLVKVMNALDYDAIGLGNHEFDYGTVKLRNVLDALDAPVVCANVRVSQREHFTSPWTIVTRQLECSDGQSREIKVGLIGFVTPLQVHWGPKHSEEPITTDDILAAAMTHLPALRRAGADIAVALAHTGIGPVKHSYGMENAAYPLASLRGIDVVLLGHTHDQFPSEKFEDYEGIDCEKGLILGTPTVMAGQLGEALGQIDLELQFDDDEWQIVGQDVRVVAVANSNAPPDPLISEKLAKAITPLHGTTQKMLSEPKGKTGHPISSHFNSFGYDPTIKLIGAAKKQAIQDGLKGTQYEGLPLLSSAASFRAGGRQGATNFIEIPSGPVTAKHLAAIAPFDNPICAVLRRGWQVREWLEEVSQLFNQVPDQPGSYPLLNDAFPTYHFDTLLGLEYSFDLSAPISKAEQVGNCSAKSRVPVLKYAGADVLDDDIFIVATSRFRAMGGGCMGHVPEGDIVHETQQTVRYYMAQELDNGYQWSNSPNWTFVPLPGTKLLLDTNPRAVSHIPDPQIEATNVFHNGFQQFKLTL